jgi:iron(III) transport system substrate-binding protein
VSDGEYALALTYEGVALQYVKGGGPVGIIYPEEGTVLIPDAVAIIKGARNLDSARKFMDFMFTKEAQEMLSKKDLLRPARQDVALAEGLIPTQQIKLAPFDMNWAGTQRDKILADWKSAVTATGY